MGKGKKTSGKDRGLNESAQAALGTQASPTELKERVQVRRCWRYFREGGKTFDYDRLSLPF